ncbi:MAG: helix-turn-helix domain-containing protein [Chlorobiaceae bacterium]|nr:helix-turn-helix domain-containing protein [Chlorobiaceae bacterium]
MTETDTILSEIRALRTELAEMRNVVTMTTAEAAAYLKCAPQTIRNMMQRGDLVAIMAGSDMRFRKCDLDSNVCQTLTSKAESLMQLQRIKRAKRSVA